jgi:hypothetical protein
MPVSGDSPGAASDATAPACVEGGAELAESKVGVCMVRSEHLPTAGRMRRFRHGEGTH